MSRVSGKQIIQAIVEDMYEGREDLRFSILPPGVYRVYVHETDYQRLLPIVRQIIGETSRALDEAVDRRNGKLGGAGAGLFEKLRRAIAGFKEKAQSIIYGEAAKRVWAKPSEGWRIFISADPNGELLPGDLCVDSELLLPPRLDLGEGNKTRNLTTIRRRGRMLRTNGKYMGGALACTRAPAAAGGRRPDQGRPQKVYALIRYKSEAGEERTFEVTKNLILVGCGGRGRDVDIILAGVPGISREHFALRRSVASGKFYIKDTSRFGTQVNGRPLPVGRSPSDLKADDVGFVTELPARAEIDLAGSLKIEFEALCLLGEGR